MAAVVDRHGRALQALHGTTPHRSEPGDRGRPPSNRRELLMERLSLAAANPWPWPRGPEENSKKKQPFFSSYIKRAKKIMYGPCGSGCAPGSLPTCGRHRLRRRLPRCTSWIDPSSPWCCWHARHPALQAPQHWGQLALQPPRRRRPRVQRRPRLLTTERCLNWEMRNPGTRRRLRPLRRRLRRPLRRRRRVGGTGGRLPHSESRGRRTRCRGRVCLAGRT
jgi:hypothetical protein